jgi:hypothetical protein
MAKPHEQNRVRRGMMLQAYREERRVAEANKRELGNTTFYGLLCHHALIMIAALKPVKPERKTNFFSLGIQLGTVHCAWIALLERKIGTALPAHKMALEHIANLLRNSSTLLVELIVEDKRCTMAQLTRSPELEAIAAMHTDIGLLCKDLLQGFTNYVASLCHLYQARERRAEAKYWVLFRAGALGQMLDNKCKRI